MKNDFAELMWVKLLCTPSIICPTDKWQYTTCPNGVHSNNSNWSEWMHICVSGILHDCVTVWAVIAGDAISPTTCIDANVVRNVVRITNAPAMCIRFRCNNVPLVVWCMWIQSRFHWIYIVFNQEYSRSCGPASNTRFSMSYNATFFCRKFQNVQMDWVWH